MYVHSVTCISMVLHKCTCMYATLQESGGEGEGDGEDVEVPVLVSGDSEEEESEEEMSVVGSEMDTDTVTYGDTEKYDAELDLEAEERQ